MDGAVIIIPFILGFIALVIGGLIWSHIVEKRRREAFAALAAGLGLTYHPDHDHALAERLGFLDQLQQGSNRYAYNLLAGEYGGHQIKAFDYHYETHSTDSKGHRHTHHHHFSCFVLRLGRSFPELTIAKEGFFAKVAQAFGFDDIDFESAEFSRRFLVRSKDKRFAYDFCHARMMEYLLANPDLTLEVEGSTLASAFSHRLQVERIRPELDRLVALRQLMPDYLFAA